MEIRRALELALRAIVAYTAMIALAAVAGPGFGAMLLPAFRAVARLSAGGLSVALLDLETIRGEARFVLLALGPPYGSAAPAYTATTLLGHALQHPIVLFTVLLAWPGVRPTRRFALCAAGLPMLWLVECLDVPIVLAGNVAALAERTQGVTPLLAWIDFLGAGGRVVLPLCIAVAMILAARSVERRLASDAGRPSPYSPPARPN